MAFAVKTVSTEEVLQLNELQHEDLQVEIHDLFLAKGLRKSYSDH